MIEAIYKCHDVNQTVIAFINKIREEVGNRSMRIQAVRFRKKCLRYAGNRHSGADGRSGIYR